MSLREMTVDEFYTALTARNRGLIPAAAQEELRTIRIVVAGCGSTGGAVVEPLARTGVTRFLVADPDVFELTNLNRQCATLADIGRNKATVAAESITSINPYAEVEVLVDGIPEHGAQHILRAGDLVIDAIDVTTATGIAAKVALHRAAASIRVPVITAYDIAGTQLIEVFDYRRGGRALGGKVAAGDGPDEALAALIPPLSLPGEILPIIEAGPVSSGSGFPQLAMTARLFGALVVPIVLALVEGRRLPRRIRLDLFATTRPRTERVRKRVATLLRLPLAWTRARRKAGVS